MTRNEKLLITVNALYFLGGTMSGVFVNVYLYSFTGSLTEMTVYAMIRFGLFPLGFLLGGFFSKRTHLAWTLTAGLVIIVGTMGFLLGFNAMFETHYYFIYLIGVFFGIGEGMYWFSVNNMSLAVSNKATRGMFIATMSIANTTSTVLAPSIAALIVNYAPTETQGYLFIFQVVIVVHSITAYLASRISVKANPMSYTLLDKFNTKHDAQWRYMMNSHLLFGIRDSITLVLTGLMLYAAIGNNGSLYSRLLIGFAVIGIIASAIVRKVQNRRNRLTLYTYSAFVLFTATMILVLSPNVVGGMVYGVLNAFAAPFFINPYSIIVMNAMQDYTERGSVYGHMIIKEVMLNIGRLIGMGFILLSYSILPVELYLPVAVFSSAIFAPILVLYANRYHHRRDALKAN
jgi:MFS transporter, YQGE family, putative transporter